jgi:large subunit ribosomal protein L31
MPRVAIPDVSRSGSMKQGIHPEYHEARVTCACGETFVTGSTKKSIRVEICSKCHPFYTGQRKFVDAEGRVQKFARKYGIKV